MEDHHFEGVEQQDVPGIIVGHPLDGRDASGQVQIRDANRPDELPHPLEIEVGRRGRTDRVDQGVHGGFGFLEDTG